MASRFERGTAPELGEQSSFNHDDDEVKNVSRFEVLIMSEAGKPIYSYSKREDSVTLMPLCCSLLNYAKKAQKEVLKKIQTSDNLIINFSVRPPLIIVLIHNANSYLDPVILIDQVEAQVISILTAKTLRSLFEERPTYDLKKLIYGSEKLIDSILNFEPQMTQPSWPWVQAYLAVQNSSSSLANRQMDSQQGPATIASAKPHRILIPIVTMPPSSRDSLHNILTSVISSNSKSVVFSLLFRVIGPKGYSHDYEQQEPIPSDKETDLDKDDTMIDDNRLGQIHFQLMTICNHHNRHKLKIADIQLIHALLDGTRSQLETVDFLWMPVCLPRFNEDAFLHTYMAFTNQKNNCLVMFSVDREEFSNCQQARTVIEERIDKLLNDSTQRNKLYYRLSNLVDPQLLDLQVKLMNLSIDDQQHHRHNVDHNPPDVDVELEETKQKISTFSSKPELYQARQLQFLWYQTKKQVLWWQRSKEKPLSPVLYYLMNKMFRSSLKTLWVKLSDGSAFLGWHVPSFQLYTQFDPNTSTDEATEVIQRITNWIKKEEDNFSIKEYREN